MRPRVIIANKRLSWNDLGGQINGGAERYLYELARLIQDLGWDVWIAYNPETVEDEGESKKSLRLIETWNGFPTMHLIADSAADYSRLVSEASAWADLTIYMDMRTAYPHIAPNNILVSHGVWWDYPTRSTQTTEWSNFRSYLERLIGPARLVVSCDANTINVFGALFCGAYLHRFRHIPNFVDTARFLPGERPEEPITVLFPNRVEHHKGYADFLAAAVTTQARYPNTNFRLVGHGLSAEHEQTVQEQVAQLAGNSDWLTWRHCEPDEMPAEYAQAHIAVCAPHGISGTSLTVLEAMSAECAVITSYVGGNAQLVLDNFNGIMIEPTATALTKAVLELVERPDLRRELGTLARLTALQSFGIDRWRRDWQNVLESAVL